MSLFDYRMSATLIESDPSFSSLIMAAYRKADSRNATLLQLQFPEIVSELIKRYNAPGGLLPEDER